MKQILSFNWLKKMFTSDDKAKKLQLLREQRQILCNGVQTTAEVIDTGMQNDIVGNMVQIRLMLKLKKADGSYLYSNTASLVTLRHLPGKGDLLHIKYIPDSLDMVVIL
ncbi:MAG TPA: hypothetical protein PK695_12480 [Chitinophagaceae bacterium]|nr:hypothetical protein [Candidatus Parvibacillus calidus]MBX2937083.1 hypothetical protein [Saprospiraceae bacterium]HMX77034.1 hypothetical protein [Chitinophagaceae bacterium]HMY64888.1 hypothetical protein [Bacteroidia bacterium]MCO5282434.1 hypothetical protein [Saprospiraceae bacterium]